MTEVMIRVCGARAVMSEKAGLLTAGMVGAVARFSFDGAWNGLSRVAVFRCGSVTRDAVSWDGDSVKIPAEVLREGRLFAGVEGRNADGSVVIPTVWAECGTVLAGANASGDPSTDPGLEVWAQILGMIGQLSDLQTADKSTIVAAINEALKSGGGSVDEAAVERIVEEYLREHPVETDPVDMDAIGQMVEAYLREHPPEVVTDTELLAEGIPADAYVTGQNIRNIGRTLKAVQKRAYAQGEFISFKDTVLDIVGDQITLNDGFLYAPDERITVPKTTVDRNTESSVCQLVYDREDKAVYCVSGWATLEDDQILVAVISKAYPGSVNANVMPGKWSVDGVIYPQTNSGSSDVDDQVAAVVSMAKNVGPYITFKNTTLDVEGDVVTLNDGFLYARDQRIQVPKTVVTPASGTTMIIIVYDRADSTVKTITGFDGFTDDQILIAIVAQPQYRTNVSSNYIPGNWSVDGVIYPQSGGAPVTARTAYVSAEGDDSNAGDESAPFRTINKAVASGATKIRVAAGAYREAIDVTGNGGDIEIVGWFDDYTDNKVVLDFGTKLTMSLDASTGLAKAAFSSASADFIYKAFVAKTEDLIYSKEAGNYSFGFTAYACNLWNGDTKLTPVLTLAECQSTAGTWYYDGTNVYANGSAGTYTLADGSTTYGINLVDFNRVVLSGIDVIHAKSDGVRLYGCSDARIDRCTFGYSGLYTGLALVNSSAVVRNCEAMFNRTDGLNIHGGGTADFFDCVSHDNGDDGISHHDTSGGMVIGGEYYNNGKGGVCSPTFGSRNGINGVYIHDNPYGVYALADTDGEYPEALVTGCAIVNNNVGIRARRYRIRIWNNTLLGNTHDFKEEDGGSVTAMVGGTAEEDTGGGGAAVEAWELLYDVTTDGETAYVEYTFVGQKIKNLMFAVYATAAETAATSTTVKLTTDEKATAYFRNVTLRLPAIPQTVDTTLVSTFEIIRESEGNSIAVSCSRLDYYPATWSAEQLQRTVHTVNYVLPSPTDAYENKMGDYITGVRLDTVAGMRIKIWGVKG